MVSAADELVQLPWDQLVEVDVMGFLRSTTGASADPDDPPRPARPSALDQFRAALGEAVRGEQTSRCSRL